MSNRSNVLGAVLAAGWSRRMGKPKALLHGPDGRSFVASIVQTLYIGGLRNVVVVGRPDDEDLRQSVALLQPVTPFVDNPDAERGQLTSIQAAVERAGTLGSDGLLIIPVDMPFVGAQTVTAVLDDFRACDAPIARVTHRGQHGHPVIFGAAVFDELRAADPSIGAKAVVRAHSASILDVEVEDPGVLRDLDSVDDYRAAFGTDPE